MEQIPSYSTSPEHLQLILEIASEDPHDGDPALVDAIGRDLIELLEQKDHTVQPIYTGQRGGDILVDIGLTLTTFLSSVWAQKEIILADGSALVTILGTGVAIKRFLQQIYKKRAGKHVTTATPIHLTLEIQGFPVQIEVPDLASAEELLAFAHQLQAEHPAAASQVTLHNKVKAKAHVARRPKSTRR